MSKEHRLGLKSLEIFAKPFTYFTVTEGFGKDISSSILDWLEAEAPWEFVETDFYEQYEFSLLGVQIPTHLAFLRDRKFLDDLLAKVQEIFERPLSDQIDCTFHKLVKGQRIRIHNDFIPGKETHRLLIQLNRGWEDDQGGFLMFFNSDDPADVYRIFAPINDSVVGFTISEHSHHAVSTIHGGERFTIVYSFYEAYDG